MNTLQWRSLIDAAAFAVTTGRGFNRHWTIHTERAGVPVAERCSFIGRVLRLASACARRHGGELAALWVRESGEGKGEHVHFLLHLPAGLNLRNSTRRWIKAAGGNPSREVSRVVTIAGGLHHAEHGGEHYAENLGALVGYLLKGADDDAASALGLARHGEAGLIVGKRCGWTQNIGRQARARWRDNDAF